MLGRPNQQVADPAVHRPGGAAGAAAQDALADLALVGLLGVQAQRPVAAAHRASEVAGGEIGLHRFSAGRLAAGREPHLRDSGGRGLDLPGLGDLRQEGLQGVQPP